MGFLCIAVIFVISSVAHAGTLPLVDVKQKDPSILVDMLYYGTSNFVGKPVDGYKANVCYLTEEAAKGLRLSQARLKAEGKRANRNYSLLVRDCYRPIKAVKHFVRWADDPNDLTMKAVYYPDLSKHQLIEQNYISPVSGHSRGSSIDLTIVELTPDGIRQLDMGTSIDFFSEKSNTDSPLVSAKQKESRQLLKKVMSPEFKNYSKEWWHYVLTKEPSNESLGLDVEPSKTTMLVSPQEIVTQISEPKILTVLDKNNAAPLSIYNLLSRIHAAAGLEVPKLADASRANNSDLVQFGATYKKVVEQISGDLNRISNELDIDWEKDITKTYDPSAAKTEEGKGKLFRGNGNVTRIFNERWLQSVIGKFTLSGVANRIDRMYFTEGTCGEIRFIYRLAYETQMKGETYASRLPLTMSVLFTYPSEKQNCTNLARQWQLEVAKDDPPEAFARRLVSGPLDFQRLTFKQLEINVQAARFPSDLENVTGRKFAGQAIYLLRIFGLKNGSFVPLKLENTPDVFALSKNETLKRKLKDYIKENFQAIDSGTFTLPEEYLANIAISYSTLGSSRIANRPFDLLFKPEELDGFIGKVPAFAQNGSGLLERLNTFTCMGCHQNSSTAGFHFLGRDRIDFGAKPDLLRSALDGNRLALPFSPHFFSEQPRRAKYIADLANGRAPSTFRAHPSAPPADWSKSEPKYQSANENMPCPLDSDYSLAKISKWNCSSGLKCQEVVPNKSLSFNLGQCLPDRTKIYGGLSCRKSAILDSTLKQLNNSSSVLAYNLRSFRDQVTTDDQIYSVPEGKISASQYNCRPTKIGVPLGRITKACSPDQFSLSQISSSSTPKEICAVVGGKGFEEMAKGYFSSAKFAEGVGRGLLNTCSPTKFCREDYICQEMPEFLANKKFGVSLETINALHENNIGFCTPTYFVYQLRLDGHPNP